MEPEKLLDHSGAISLPIDFPTEGRVYHFKKLKSNASLTFWITRPQSFERWKWLVVFLIAGALAKAAFGYLDRRQSRAARAGRA